jgi:hypothetical protein
VLPVNPDLTLKSFDITAGDVVESHESGTYRLLYNDKLQAFAEIENSAEATPIQTTLRMELMKYNEGANAMETVKTITIPTQKYEPGSVTRVTADITDLEVGGRYALCIKNKLTNVTDGDALNMGSTDSILYFKVCPPTLECLSVDGTIMRLSGAWDALLFSTLAVDPEVTVYDLTQVSGISGQPIASNPNALFLVGKEMNGYNIVYDGICEELRLQPNFNFTPIDEFIARRATFIPKWDISQGWQPFALPFTAVRPLGYLCQRVTSISSFRLFISLSATLLSPMPARIARELPMIENLLSAVLVLNNPLSVSNSSLLTALRILAISIVTLPPSCLYIS